MLVFGHVDTKSFVFPSNWERSAAASGGHEQNMKLRTYH